MALTESEFVELLTTTCPETQATVDEHLSVNDNEVLIHLLVADIRRFAIDRFEVHDTVPLNRCLIAVSTGLTDGDEHVENAIAVSFVEDTGWWDPEMKPFIAIWPSPLLEEAKRQRDWRPQAPDG